MYNVSIDRIGLVMPVADKEMHAYLCGQFHSMKGEPGFTVWKTKYQTFAIIPLGPHQSLRLQAGVARKKKYLRVDFNPAGLAAQEWALLHAHLDYLVDFGYATVLAKSHVTYLEIAADFKGVVWKGLFLFDPALRNSLWHPTYYSPTPTNYIGRRGSNRVIRAYDRVARLKAAGIPTGDEPVTRIEASLRKLGCKVQALSQIANPFKSVGVCRFDDIEAECPDAEWKQFLKHCRWIGACEASQLLGPVKKKYLTLLKSTCCDWWSPDQIWSSYPSALHVLQGCTKQIVLESDINCKP